MKRILLAPVGVIFLVALILSGAPALTQAAPPNPDPQSTPAVNGVEQIASQALVQSVDAALTDPGELAPVFDMYDMGIDHVEYSADGATALVFLAPLDPETGEMLGTEPVLAIAHRDVATKGPDAGWDVGLQFSANWVSQLESLPDELLNDDLRERYLASEDEFVEKATNATTYGGYRLPWAGGLTKRLSMGAHHLSCLSTCTYAFDFADGTMFPMLAAKGGTVYHWSDTCPNGSTGCTNSLTIEDTSTSPTTYQIYLHLREGSIPEKLKTKGTPVMQGEYIGDVDDTGYSSGHHVHFMVVTSARLSSSGYMWGTSVDITFRDVAINWDAATQGGRPCLVSDIGYGKCSEAQTTYTSQNAGSNPPTGTLSAPAGNQTITTPTVHVSGAGSDNLGVTRLQVLANSNGTWREVGPSQTNNPFSYDLDLCASNIPDGPFDLGLRVWDYEGNQSIAPLSVRSLIKDYPCPAAAQTTCTAGDNQIAVFADANYSGACQVFEPGEYNSQQLGSLGNDNAASVQVGANVQAVLYDGIAFHQRTETLVQSDPNLADNRLIANRVSSIKVQQSDALPMPPVVENPWAGGLVTTVKDSIVLAWDSNISTVSPGGGSVEYKVEISGPPGYTPPARSEWSSVPSWSLGSLPAGNYSFQVWGRNLAGEVSAPSTRVDFTVNGIPTETPVVGQPRSYLPLVTVNAAPSTDIPVSLPWIVPHQETLESGAYGWTWRGSWRMASVDGPSGSTSAWVSNQNNSLGSGLLSASDLTTPPILVPEGGAWLRFDYRYQTEDSNPFWDQRRVQISVDDEPFKDVLQLSGEAMNTWLTSPAIALADYAGQSVRIRFHENPIDLWSNGNLSGWTVDNLAISQTPPPTCSDPSETTPGTNDVPTGPAVVDVSPSQPRDGQICPFDDVDYYRFSANAGDHVGVNLDAATLNPASSLDSVVTLFDGNGLSLMTENDDEVAQVQNDSALSFQLPHSGTYYLRVKSWDYPTSGGLNYTYRLTIAFDTTPPSAPAVTPGTNGFLPGSAQQLTATTSDVESGISHVAFYWHSNDWAGGVWTLIGHDWNGSDGWNVPFNAASLAEANGYAVYAAAYNGVGMGRIGAAWNVGMDRTAPTLQFNPLAANSDSTAFALRWSAADNLSGYDHVVLEKSVNGAAWEPSGLTTATGAQQAWFVGAPGVNYSFRLTAYDRAGNASSPQIAGPTTIFPTCNGDPFEAGSSDNAYPQASLLAVDSSGPVHTFCKTAGGALGDVDWYRADVIAGQTYVIGGYPEANSPAGARLTVYGFDGAPEGATALASAAASDLGAPVSLIWQANYTGLIYIRAESIDPNVAGDGVSYQVRIGRNLIFLPAVQR